MPPIHISLRAENIFHIFQIPISNSLLTTWLVMVFLILISLISYTRLSMIPGKWQLILELLIGGFYSFFKEILDENTDKYFGYVMTLFIFIIFVNWSGILPGVGTIGLYSQEENKTPDKVFAASRSLQSAEGKNIENHSSLYTPLFRAGTADLNMTLSLAILTIAYVQYAGLSALGTKYLSKFFNFSNPINFVVGILEIISELSRIISFAFRLFGNIFAGEVLLTVISFLAPILAPVPFLGLELFVGFIQALVFAMLTSVFFSLATHHADY